MVRSQVSPKKNGVRVYCNTENCVPIVVPVLSTAPSFIQAHRQLRNCDHRKVKVQHLFQYGLIVGEQMSQNGEKNGSRLSQKFKNQEK